MTEGKAAQHHTEPVPAPHHSIAWNASAWGKGKDSEILAHSLCECVHVLKQASDEEKPHYRSTQDSKNHGMESSQAGGAEKGQVRPGMLQRLGRGKSVKEVEGSREKSHHHR